MLRLVVYLLISIFLITFIRMVIGLIGKTFAGLFQASPPQASGGRGPSGVKLGGELKKDPVCGTYVSVETSVKKTVGGQVLHFCSEQCRDRHTGSG